jgi:DNA-binding transcriptional ArsR family regulator
VSRQRSGDLFPTDQPLPASQLIGREADVRELSAALLGGSSMVIAGPRRTGKTSVCDAALGICARSAAYTVSVDLFRISNAAELAEVLVAKTIANRSQLRKILHQARRAGRLLADTAGVAAVVRSKTQLGEEIEIAFHPGLAARDPERYLDYALALPGRIAEADSRPVVVFFDEFQELASPNKPYGDPDRLTKRMRAIFQRQSGVSYLFAGSIEHLMRDLFVPRQRALSQFGSFHELRPIEPEDWATGLQERFAADDCTLDEQALTRLVELGELHPRATMLIAQKTHLASVLLETHTIDSNLVDQGYLAALQGERINHEQTVERIRQAHKLGLEIARRIARGEPAYPSLPRGAVRRALEELRDAAIIESRRRGDWQFTDPLLRRYLHDLLPIDAP